MSEQNINKMDSAALDSLFFSGREDIVNQLFSEAELNSLSAEYDYKVNDNNPLESEPEISEKCRFVIDSIDLEDTADSLSIAIELSKDYDFDSQRLKEFGVQSKLISSSIQIPFDFYALFFNEDYYSQFCSAVNLTPAQQEELDMARSNVIDHESLDLPFFLNEQSYYKSFLIFNLAAIIEKERNVEYEDSVDEFSYMHCLRTIKDIVNEVKDKYLLWENSISNVYNQMAFSNSLDYFNADEGESAYQRVLYIFIQYYITYSDNWKKICFESLLAQKCCNSPKNCLRFVKELTNHKYCRDFCREYEKYLTDTGSKPLFNLNLIKPITPIIIDTDKTHHDWFEQVHKSKVKSGEDVDLYNAFSELYSALVDYGYIPEGTMKALFVYRFTGFLSSFPLDVKIKWTGANNVLAFLLKCLYTHKDGEFDINSPKYKKLSEYYTPKMSNGSALADSLDNKKKKRIIQTLNDCGFINVDPSKIK